MCGLVGLVFGRSENVVNKGKLLSVLEQGLVVGDLRGGDGTGILSVTAKTVEVFKRAAQGSDFINIQKVRTLLRIPTTLAILGHHRRGTFGTTSDKNAHPFTYGNIALFHNGTLNVSTPNLLKYDVDSESIADSLSKSLDVPTTLGEIHGAFSLVWYDYDKDTINFARNKERPMYFAEVGNKSLLYASEAGMLEWLCSRNNLVINKLYATTEGLWLSMDSELGLESLVETKFIPRVDVFDEYEFYSDYYKAKGFRSHSKVIINKTPAIKNLPVPMDQGAILYSKSLDGCAYCGKSEGDFLLVGEEALCTKCAEELNYCV